VFVEGARPIDRLLLHGWEVESLWWCRERPLSHWAQGVIARARAATHYDLPATLMTQLSEREEPSELVAVARMPAEDPDRIAWRPDLLVIVFDRPGSPGNLGTLVRAADALGAHGLIVTGHGVDPYDPRTIRASLGSVFALPVVRLPGPAQLAAWLASLPQRPRVVGTDSEGAVDLWDAVLVPPLVVVVGHEATGISYGLRQLCDLVTRIPLSGSADSLNVAVAASIVLYEIRRATIR
jgi:TrmH family RNA methyltransferase